MGTTSSEEPENEQVLIKHAVDKQGAAPPTASFDRSVRQSTLGRKRARHELQEAAVPAVSRKREPNIGMDCFTSKENCSSILRRKSILSGYPCTEAARLEEIDVESLRIRLRSSFVFEAEGTAN